jgi:hypothetical protein
MSEIMAAFPAADSAALIKVGRKTVYRTPDGDMNRVTTILEALPKPFLVPWAANIEREAVLTAAVEVYIDPNFEGGPGEFRKSIEDRLGTARQHQKALEKGAEVGSFIHDEIQRRTRIMLGLPAAPPQEMPEAAMLGVMAWEDWFGKSGLKPFRCEQVVWDKDSKTCGTIDLLAFNEAGDLGVIDYKSSKGIYDSHHVQVAKYVQMACNFTPVTFANICRLPKSLDDKLFSNTGEVFEVKPLGEMYDRTLSLGELLRAFEAARTIYTLLTEKPA